MAAKPKQTHKPNEKDYITNKVLLVFTLCLCGVLALMMLYRLLAYGSSYSTGVIVSRIILGLSIAGMVFGAYMLSRERKNNTDMRFRLWRGKHVLLVTAVIFVCMLFISYFGARAIKPLYIILPAVAVYYLIFHSYPREFFIVSLDCGLAATLLLVVRRAFSSTNFVSFAYISVAAALVLAGAQVILLSKIRQRGGITGLIDGKTEKLFTAPHAYPMMFASAAVLLILVALGAFLGAQIAYYMIFVSIGYLFVTAVYYTVKMM